MTITTVEQADELLNQLRTIKAYTLPDGAHTYQMVLTSDLHGTEVIHYNHLAAALAGILSVIDNAPQDGVERVAGIAIQGLPAYMGGGEEQPAGPADDGSDSDYDRYTCTCTFNAANCSCTCISCRQGDHSDPEERDVPQPGDLIDMLSGPGDRYVGDPSGASYIGNGRWEVWDQAGNTLTVEDADSTWRQVG